MNPDWIAAAHGAACESLRRGECLALPVPTAGMVLEVLHVWHRDTTLAEVRRVCLVLALPLADT